MSDRKSIKSDRGSEQTDFTVHRAHRFSHCRATPQLYKSRRGSLSLATRHRTTGQDARAHILGLRLFERSGRGIVLTPAGQDFLNYADRLLTRLAKRLRSYMRIHTLKRGSVVIGASISAGTYVVPPLLGSFHARYPQIRITLLIAHRRTIEDDLLTYKIDLGVVGHVEQQERFVVELLRPYKLLVVASPFHRLAGRRTIPLHELQKETFC